MRFLYLLAILLPASAFTQNSPTKNPDTRLNKIAEDYVRLGLAIGQYDGDFVDAYYGPDSLKPSGQKLATFPKDSFLVAVENLQSRLQPFKTSNNPTQSQRAKWISSQLTAFGRRVKMFAGEKCSFEQQAKELFGGVPPAVSEDHFRSLLSQLETLLPGKGLLTDRFQSLASRFVVPKEKLDTIIKTAIAESKKRTLNNFSLPASENFRMEYVTGKVWSGYNWYLGNYQSLLQFNEEVTSYVDRMLDVASHEGYPGHHVYNTLLEKNLYRDKGWAEISLYPLFSPQSLIAEGSANYGIDIAFPYAEKIKFVKEHLLPLAGLDTTGLSTYFTALEIRGALSHVRTEVCRRLLNEQMDEHEANQWLIDYALLNEKDAERSLAFIKKNQAYVINYTYGKDLVASYITSHGGTAKNSGKRCSLFKWILSNEVTTADLEKR